MEYTWSMQGNVLTPTGVIQNATIYIKGKRIDALDVFAQRPITAGVKSIDARGYLIAPGYIDAHTHGGSGHDFMHASAGDIADILSWLATTGVTSVLPTIATGPLEEQLRAIKSLREAKEKKPKGAEIIGIHLEGPYINPEKRGAQLRESIREINLPEMKQMIEAGGGLIKIVTLAPELPGAFELIRYLIEEDVIVSVGHSSASYDQVIQAAEAGLKRATHLFNAMASFHQREPGPVGAALLRDDIYAELILDGIHVHPATAQAVLRMKGLDRVVLISDAIAAAGVSDGIYEGLGGQKIRVEGGAARLDSGALAGSTLTMDQAVRNAVQMLGLSAEEAIRIASQTAAESLGFETQSTKGVISPGKDADLIVLDDSVSVILTMVAGEVVYQERDRSLIG